jgi:Ca2+-binding EF-hand superfamily protein
MILASLGATALAGTAMAQQGAAPSAPRTMKADANGDGALSRAEFMAQAEARFARLDADKNGLLTREERKTARAAMRSARGERRTDRMGGGGGARMLASFDSDRDGRVSLAEFQGGVGQRMQNRPLREGVTAAQRNERLTGRFKRWDSNADGYVDQTEMATIQPRARRGAAPSPM